MIVLRRKKHEQIIINGNITVTVMDIRRARVSLGVEAPENIRIFRNELRPQATAVERLLSDQADSTAVS